MALIKSRASNVVLLHRLQTIEWVKGRTVAALAFSRSSPCNGETGDGGEHGSCAAVNKGQRSGNNIGNVRTRCTALDRAEMYNLSVSKEAHEMVSFEMLETKFPRLTITVTKHLSTSKKQATDGGSQGL
jgi:hypothetical protein